MNMIAERANVCEGCKGPCRQIIGPISKEEYEYIGATPDDYPTLETFGRFMEISLKPECRERMLEEHPLEWWFNRIPRYTPCWQKIQEDSE